MVGRHVLVPHLGEKTFQLLIVLYLDKSFRLFILASTHILWPAVTDRVLTLTASVLNALYIVNVATLFDQLLEVEAALDALAEVILLLPLLRAWVV